jgi:DNA primase
MARRQRGRQGCPDAPEFAPKWVRTERVDSKDSDRDIDYFVVDDAETLRYVANRGTIPIHVWTARIAALERPDWLVIDLDAKGAPFTDVVVSDAVAEDHETRLRRSVRAAGAASAAEELRRFGG